MLDKIKQLMEVKKQADQLKRELDACQVEVTEARGIKIVITGSQNFQSIEIDESLLTAGSKRNLEHDLLRSVNAAIRKSQNLAAEKMKNMTGFNLPGF